MAAEFHVGDIGTALRCTIRDEDGVIVNLSSFTLLQIKLMKPNRTLVYLTAILFSDGTDGIMEYITISENDLDQMGLYKLQGIVTFGDSATHKSNIENFFVEPNI